MDKRDKIIHKHQIELTDLIIESKEKEVWNYSRLISRLDWNDENDVTLPGYHQKIKDLNSEIDEERKRLLYLWDQLNEGKFATRASYQA
tara:strand:+ start:435 stop:701 length:267 start_codon:yes stop_codon:yes gene_type:complete